MREKKMTPTMQLNCSALMRALVTFYCARKRAANQGEMATALGWSRSKTNRVINVMFSSDAYTDKISEAYAPRPTSLVQPTRSYLADLYMAAKNAQTATDNTDPLDVYDAWAEEETATVD